MIKLEFPIDTLYPYYLVNRELGTKPEVKSFGQKIVNLYLGNYLATLFAGAFDKQDFTPIKPIVPFADESQSNKK